MYFLSWDWGWVRCSWESRQSESVLGIGNSQCKGPGVGVAEHWEGLGVWRACWEEMRPESEVTFMLLSPPVLFSVDTPFLHFCYGLVSFKCIWNEISNANSLVRREGLISLWFFSTEHYLWISGEGYEGFDFFLVWPHYVNFPIVSEYENIKAITHLYEGWMCREVVMETRGRYSCWLEYTE